MVARGIDITPSNTCFSALGEQQDVVVTVDRDFVDLDGEETIRILHDGLTDPTFLDVVVHDVDRAAVEISPSLGIVQQEGGHLDVAVALATKPTHLVNLTFDAQGGNGLVELSPEFLLFDDSSWSTAQTVSVSALEDTDPSITFEIINLYPRATSSDAKYDGVALKVSPVDHVDIEWLAVHKPRVILSASTLEVVEGTEVDSVYRVRLDTAIAGSDVVVVDIDASDTSLRIQPDHLKFSAADWSEEQTVSVSFPRDYEFRGSTIFSSSLEHSIRAGSEDGFVRHGAFWPSATLQVSIYDADTPEIVLSEQSGYVTEGGQGTYYQLQLHSKPTADVVVSILNPNSELVSVSPSALTFSAANWNVSRQIDVDAVESSNDNAFDLASAITVLQHKASSADPVYNGDQARFAPTSLYVVRRYELADNPPCPQGTYRQGLECVACPAGFMCPLEAGDPQPCGLGLFSVAGQLNCTLCPAGFSCASPFSDQMSPCDEGTYSIAGQDACVPCPAGKMCPFTDVDAVFSCVPGSYSLGLQANCTQCPPGKECPDASGIVINDCAPGSYATGGFAACLSCPAGFQCPRTDTAPTDTDRCAPGQFTPSTGNAVQCASCPAGYACPFTDQNVMIPCEAGEFALGTNTSCVPCPAGMACTPSIGPYEVCENGYYSEAGMDDCHECPEGYECTNPATLPRWCPSGSYAGRGSTECSVCEAGYVCPVNGTAVPDICPAGTYSYSGSSKCEPCSPGYWCGEGAVSPTPALDICRAGGYCTPPDVAFTPCPAGTFGAFEGGQSAEHACQPCPEGRFCEEGASPDTHGPCPSGHYCPQNTTFATQFPCPAGTYNPDPEKASSAACLPTPEGSYSSQGSATVYPCPSGYFCPAQTGSYLSFPCPSGTYSGAVQSLTESGQCKACEPGAFCPVASINPTLCDEGTYNPSPGGSVESNCLPCPAGWSCPDRGMVSYFDSPCVPGYYCPTGTSNPYAYPCPAGTFTDADDTIREEDCTPCAAGTACHVGTGGVSGLQPVSCAAGHYCPQGTRYATEFSCPRGTFTEATDLTGPEECTPCPAGRYCAGGLSYIGSSSDTDGLCAKGHYCPAQSWRARQNDCPAGTFTGSQNLSAVEQCTPCWPGHYCLVASEEPLPCPAGSFAGAEGESDPLCTACPAGHECALGTVTPVPCLVGYQSGPGQESCDACQVGHFCHRNATTADVMDTQPCPAGLYCPQGVSVEPQFAQFACPNAHYCPERVPLPIECPVGTYNPHTGRGALEDCLPCDAGYYCIAKSFEVSGVCDAGHYCPEGSTGPQQFPCPAKTYRNRTAGESEESCAVCPAGYYCEAASVEPELCPKGFYCLTASAVPEPCPLGRYGNQTGLKRPEDCGPCPGGFYCDGLGLPAPTGLCDDGYYCKTGSYTSAPEAPGTTWIHPVLDAAEAALLFDDIGDICPSGNYCPPGSSSPMPCEPGTFNNISGAGSVDACVDCLPGHYCAGYGNAEPTGVCAAGYYCPGRSDNPNDEIASPGFYAPEGAVGPTPCPHGSFNGEWAQSTCTPCLAGFYCGNLSVVTPEQCPAGTFCEGGATTPNRCPVGTFSNQSQLVAQDQCIPCTPGHYCPSNGLQAPAGPCEAGYFCLQGSPVRIPINGTYGDVCWPGYFCEEGAAFPEPCPVGTYNPKPKAKVRDECVLCEPGLYCGERGLEAPSGPCGAGYYCNGSGIEEKPQDGICPPGYYCPAGSDLPLLCSAGTFAPDQGSASCVDCPAGYFCDGFNTTHAQRCPRGHYCPPKTGAAPPLCPQGTFGNHDGLVAQESCTICPAGSYCDADGLQEVSGPCDDGYICDPGSKTQFGGGVQCIDHDFLPKDCPAGYYCQYGRSYECPLGTYNPVNGSTTQEACLACEPGHWCHVPAIARQEDYACPVGHYCHSSTAFPLPCPAGRYRDTAGARSVDDCLLCPPGHFCPGDNQLGPFDNQGFLEYWNASSGSSFSLPCPLGTYCVGGNLEPQLCPLGTRGRDNVLLRTTIEASCESCPPGTHGSDPKRLLCETCSPGYMCLEGAKSSTPKTVEDDGGFPCSPGFICAAGALFEQPCPEGTYNNLTAMSDVNEHCTPCERNTYNNLPGQRGCRPCASSSSSNPNALKCECQGRNRAFEPASGRCLCVPGFQAFDQMSGFSVRLDNDDDGVEDCQPITFPRCGPTQVLASDGECVTEQDRCALECGQNETGRIDAALGICDCDDVLPIEEICDVNCRANSSTGLLQPQRTGRADVVKLSTGVQVSLRDGLPGFTGSLTCPFQTNCSIVPCKFMATGASACSFDLEDALNDMGAGLSPPPVRRRNLEQAPSVSQPILCIQAGDSVIFDVSSGAFPVYKKDSLLNSNPSFDYSMFRTTRSLSGVNVFGFTFSDAGMYVFGSTQDFNLEMIVAVLASGRSCPTDSAIVPRTASSLLALGARRNDQLILEPDWSLFGALCLALLGVLAVVTVIMFVFRECALGTVTIVPWYRKRNSLKGKMKGPSGNAVERLGSRSVAPLRKVFNEFAGESSKLNLGHERWGAEDADPRQVVERIVANHEEVNDQLKAQDLKLNSLVSTVQQESSFLKDILQSIQDGGGVMGSLSSKPFGEINEGDANMPDASLLPLSDLHAKEKELLEKEWDKTDEDELSGLNENLNFHADQALLEEELKQEEQKEALEEMLLARDDITDEERDRILRNFEDDQQMLRDTLDVEKRRQQEDLKNRLAERKLRNRRTTNRRQRNEKRDEQRLKREALAKTAEEADRLEQAKQQAEIEEADLQLEREAVVESSQALAEIKLVSEGVLAEEELSPIREQVETMRKSIEEDDMVEEERRKEELKRAMQQQVEAAYEDPKPSPRASSTKLDTLDGQLPTLAEEGVEEVLKETAMEEGEEKLEIEQALSNETRAEEARLRQAMKQELEQATDKEMVHSIRKAHEENIAKLAHETAKKREEQYAHLQAKIARRKQQKLEGVSTAPAEVVQHTLEVEAERAKLRLEAELEQRQKDDIARRVALERREAEVARREAELVIRAAAPKQGLDPEEEVQKLRELHESALSQLGDKQADRRRQQREALEKRAADRKLQREREKQAALGKLAAEENEDVKRAKKLAIEQKSAEADRLEEEMQKTELEKIDLQLERERVAEASQAIAQKKLDMQDALEAHETEPIRAEVEALEREVDAEDAQAAAARLEELQDEIEESIDAAYEPPESARSAKSEGSRAGDKPSNAYLLSKKRSTMLVQSILKEVALEEVDEKVEIETELSEERKRKEDELGRELEQKLQQNKASQDLVLSIRKEHEENLAKLTEQTAEKRKAKYEQLQAKVARRKKQKLEDAANKDKTVKVSLVQSTLDAEAEKVRMRLELELQERKKEDLARRVALDRREADLARREAELVIRAASLKQGRDAEEEVKSLRETHEAALTQLGDKQAERRRLQRETLKKKSEERKLKRQREMEEKLRLIALEEKEDEDDDEEETQDVAEEEGEEKESQQEKQGGAAQQSDSTGSESASLKPRSSGALWEHAVDRVSITLKKKLADDEKRRLSEQHKEQLAEIKRKQEEERKRLEKEIEETRRQMLLKRQEEEEAEAKRIEEMKRDEEERLARSTATAQELESIKELHEKEFTAKLNKQRATRAKQKEKLMKKLEEKKARKEALLQRKQTAEIQQTQTLLSKETQKSSGVSIEEIMQKEKSAIATLLRSMGQGLTSNEIYRGVEKILEPRHSREKAQLSETHFQQRATKLKDAFGGVNAAKHAKKMQLLKDGASMEELERLEVESKEKLRATENEVSQSLETLHKAEQDALSKRHALEIGQYVSRYSTPKQQPVESIQRDETKEIAALQQIIATERKQRQMAIQNEKRVSEQEAHNRYEQSVLQLERSLRFDSIGARNEADASFQKKQDAMLKEQEALQRKALADASPEEIAMLQQTHRLERERLTSALRSEKLRQQQSIDLRVKRLQARSERYYKRVLQSRLHDIAEFTSKKELILEESLSRMLQNRKQRVQTVMDGSSPSGLPPMSPEGAPVDGFFLQEVVDPTLVSPRNLEELQDFRRSCAVERVHSLGHLNPGASKGGTSADAGIALQDRLDRIEQLLGSFTSGQRQMTAPGGDGDGAAAVPYSDPLDTTLTTSSEVLLLEESELSQLERRRLELATDFAETLGFAKDKVKILPARSIPANASQQCAFRNSFHWDRSSNTLFVRIERFQSVGDCVLIICHCLAHIKVHEDPSHFEDRDPQFLTAFYGSLRTIGSNLFKKTFSMSDHEQDETAAATDEDKEPMDQTETKPSSTLASRLEAYAQFAGSDSKVASLLSTIDVSAVAPSPDPPSGTRSRADNFSSNLRGEVDELKRLVAASSNTLAELESSVAELSVQIAEAQEPDDDAQTRLDDAMSAREAEARRHDKLKESLVAKERQLAKFEEQGADIQDTISTSFLQEKEKD
ncbi:Putative uncharacterized protein MYH16 (Myosin heavy chain 16 pseudogene) (myosin heavy polypeptide 5) [Durusdinium trenchii]|uniref:GCC2 and GCC3 domain-containing protein n=1 Tax=Durusdinium trenchii TaxID=1381693 RepID=A0ABP0RC94_9DINO